MKTTRIFGTCGLILATALGVSVGCASPAFAQTKTPVIVNPDGKVTYLGTLGGFYSTALGINDSGQVVGQSYTADGSRHAFITGPDGMGMRDLGTLGGAFSSAYGINNSGQVAGESEIVDRYGSYHAFITGPDGMGMTDLGTLEASSINFSEASGINNSGQVVGESTLAYGFITGPDGMGMTDLGTLGGTFSDASGINDSGQVVGHSETADGSYHAFITGPDGMGMTDLNSIVDLPGGSYLSYAQGINNQGQVIATVSAIPEPASYALMLAGLGLIGFMARSKKAGRAGFLYASADLIPSYRITTPVDAATRDQAA